MPWPEPCRVSRSHTYLNPPFHYVYLAAWFHLLGSSLIVLKLSSVGAGACAMVTTYFLGVKSGLSPWLSLLPPSLLAVDSVFLRASLSGDRTCWRWRSYSWHCWRQSTIRLLVPSLTPGTAFQAGLMSGLADADAPIGLAAVLAVHFLDRLSTPRGARSGCSSPHARRRLAASAPLGFLHFAGP